MFQYKRKEPASNSDLIPRPSFAATGISELMRSYRQFFSPTPILSSGGQKKEAGQTNNIIQAMLTRSGGKPPVTHGYSTRLASTSTSTRPAVPTVNTSVYCDGFSRPGFTAATNASLYNNPILSGGRNLYTCKISSTATQNLPKSVDATPLERAAGLYASIGHKVQWQEYVASKCDPVLDNTTPGRHFRAYTKNDVNYWYNDVNNLELQSQHYNSSIAHNHGGDSPLAPVWVDD